MSSIPWRVPKPRMPMATARSLFKMNKGLRGAVPRPRARPRVSLPQLVTGINRLRRFARKRVARRMKPSNIQGQIANVQFRYLGRKSFKGRMNPKMLKYKTSLKHSLTSTSTLQYQSATNIAKLGNSLQAQVQWYSAAVLSPALFDDVINNTSNTATGANSMVETFLENARLKLDIKSASNRGGRVTGWMCFPRRDLSVTQALSVSGLNPTLLSQGFTDVLTASQATSALSSTQAGVTPFDSQTWVSMFHMKPLFDKYFEPGQTLVVDLNWRKGLILDKARYGVKNADKISTDYNYLKDCGPLLLCKFEGTPVHDESTATLPLSSGSSTVSLGGFNFDVVQLRYITHRFPYTISTRQTGNFSALLAQAMTGANEESYVLGAYNETGDAA